MVQATAHKSLAEDIISILQKRGRLTAQQAEILGTDEGISLSELEKNLIDNYGVDPQDICLAIAEQAETPVIRLNIFTPTDSLLSQFPAEMLTRHHAVPVGRAGNTLTLALSDPFDVFAVERFADYSGLSVFPVMAPHNEIADLVSNVGEDKDEGLDAVFQEAGDSNIEVASGENEEDTDDDIGKMLQSAEDAPVIRIVNLMLMEALKKRASDIHIESFEKQLRLRYRIDGVLVEGPAPPKHLQSAIISRVKVMSDLDIAERRVPQDGRFKIKAQGHEIDLRVSILPTVHGEKICMRLLDKSNLAGSLSDLGLDPESLEKLRYAINQPHGLILVTGPTGSGKTTTLYSALQEINTPDVNITTVENPVEYQLMGINQVEIKESTGMTFAKALRSILRQDPDIVLVGETRDAETADIAVKAALTGHLVLTTLHTNDAPSAIPRLIYMGIEPFLLASSLILSQAQRLVRRICPNCKEVEELSPEYARKNHIPEELAASGQIYRGRGCSRCGNSGYKGRASIMEILLVNKKLRELILKSANAGEFKQAALEDGFNDLRENGFARIKEGITTIEEVLRVTAGEE
ncbi:MAG: GspE/PulE family protein [Verrucomicrobiota bacterium]